MIPSACAAGNYAIGYGFDLIRTGRTDLMLAGGADAISRITVWDSRASERIAPERCQPLDKNRKRMVPGEGSAVLGAGAARARGAHIYAEVLGYGLSCDSHHMTAAHPEGDGAIRAMTSVLRESGMKIADIDYIGAEALGMKSGSRAKFECPAVVQERQSGSRGRQRARWFLAAQAKLPPAP